MAKYNLQEKKEKPATYRLHIRPELIDALYEGILRKMVVDKVFRDPHYTAQRIADELQTNTRYISATMSLRFQQNFSEFLAGFRIREAAAMLTDRRSASMTMEEIALQSGFANRQTFYAAFYRFYKKTPKLYQKEFLQKYQTNKSPVRTTTKQ